MSVSEKGFRVTQKYLLFWGSVFSQWYKANFTDFNGTKFSSAEQFMFYHKALLFKDYEMLEKIMQTSDPKKQKEYGRLVKNFDNAIWEEYSPEIVTLGNYLKFKQNKELEKEMIRYKYKFFVEASPVDKIWGIGLHYNDPLAEDQTKWLGLNKLGNALTYVKDCLKDPSKNKVHEEIFRSISDKLNELEKR